MKRNKSYTKGLFRKKCNSHDLVIINPVNKKLFVIFQEYFLPQLLVRYLHLTISKQIISSGKDILSKRVHLPHLLMCVFFPVFSVQINNERALCKRRKRICLSYVKTRNLNIDIRKI